MTAMGTHGMSEERITFKSDGLDMAGVVRLPAGSTAGKRRSVFF